jgi:hypothetical protein
MAHKLLASLKARQYQRLYVEDPKAYRSDVLETLVEIVYEALTAVSNRFKGADDAFWTMVIDVSHHAYLPFGSQSDGMTPFQQRLALKLIEKLKDNMSGYYPAICRVLLSWVGPYERKATQPNRTAYNILRDAVYFELQRLPELAAENPDKVRDFLPDNVTYDIGTTELVYNYKGGEPAITRLSTLNVTAVDLIAKELRAQ